MKHFVGSIWAPGWAAAVADRPIVAGQKIIIQKGLPKGKAKKKK